MYMCIYIFLTLAFVLWVSISRSQRTRRDVSHFPSRALHLFPSLFGAQKVMNKRRGGLMSDMIYIARIYMYFVLHLVKKEVN
jgi:hypothetical protein